MSNKRILIVDDSEAQLSVMRAMLEIENYYVATLDRAENILDSIAAQDPDLLVIDQWMPGLTGGQAIGLIRGMGIQLPVLIVTALLDHEGSLGGHLAIPKPFDQDQLVEAVRSLIGPSEAQ